MEIRDPIHGSIHIERALVPVIENHFFRRLRGIKQLGLSELVFPGATHTRFIHSLGVMAISRQAFQAIFSAALTAPAQRDFIRLQKTLQLSCLLHDIGHAPLSHATESVMPALALLKLPKKFSTGDKERQATHEDYTIKAITESELTEDLSQMCQTYGIHAHHIAELVSGKCLDEAPFTVKGVNYFPLLHQLVSSEMDCDRMDYLLRDSYFCGVSYGNYDLDWLIDNLECCPLEGQAYLGIDERAVTSFDDFLLSRFHMFIMVYFHYKSVCMEKLLSKYFKSSQEYRIPSDIDLYQQHDDHFLMKTLRSSQNKHARQIVENKLPKKIFESFNPQQEKILDQIQEFLQQEGADYIRSSSQGRLSKYYQHDKQKTRYPLKVSRKIFGTSQRSFVDIDDATDLFRRYGQSHSINRLHCNRSELSENQVDAINDIVRAHT